MQCENLWQSLSCCCIISIIIIFRTRRLKCLFIFIGERRRSKSLRRDGSVQQHLQLEEMAATETVEIFTCIQMCLLVKIYFSTLDYIFLCCYMLCFFHFCSFFSQQYAFGEWNVGNFQRGNFCVLCGVSYDFIILEHGKLLF